jgi:squalene synthase HpnC
MMDACVPPLGVPTEAEVLGRARGENFPVASLVLPRRLREGLLAVYGFARLADELGDAGPPDLAERLRRLDWLEGELDRALEGRGSHPAVVRLARLVADRGLSDEPFRRLIEANRRDQLVHRYERFEDLVGYCELSAVPIGRVVLDLFGAATPENEAASDAVCVALQVIEHVQDAGEDAAAGRVYVPEEDLAAVGCPAAALLAPATSAALAAALARLLGRAKALLAEGVPLLGRLRGSAKVAVAGFMAGGLCAARAIEDAGYEVLARRPRPAPGAVAVTALRLCLGREGARS